MYSRYFLQVFYFVKYWICILLQQLPYLLLPCSSFSLDLFPLISHLLPAFRPDSKLSEGSGKSLVDYSGLWINPHCAILKRCFTSVIVKRVPDSMS